MDFTVIWTLVQQIAVVSLVPIAGALGTWLVQKIKLQSLNIKGDKWEKIKLISKVSVQSSEQQFKANKISDKKAHAIATAKRLLNDNGIKIDDDLLSELIESEVWTEINSPTINPTIVSLPSYPIQEVSNKEPSESEALG